MQLAPSVSAVDRLSRALENGDATVFDARERGMHRTYASLLWRHVSEQPVRDVPRELRAAFIRDYACLLTMLRATPKAVTAEAREELQRIFWGKYPEMREKMTV